MMDNKRDILKYLNTPLDSDTVKSIYDKNNIQPEYCSLYIDFIVSLTTIIIDTYLGDDIITSINRKIHFDWCWKKVLNDFNNEGIEIGGTDELYVYFYEFNLKVFYTEPNKTDYLEDDILTLWLFIFNINITKSKIDISTFLDVYELFTESLKISL